MTFRTVTEAYCLLRPARRDSPVVFSSPHSGRDYPRAFLAATALDTRLIRSSEDAFVDELFAGAPGVGAPLIAAPHPSTLTPETRRPTTSSSIEIRASLQSHWDRIVRRCARS